MPAHDAFQVLAEPRRRQIMDLLLQRPHAVGELVTELGLSQPGTSKHLGILKGMGFVRARVAGKRRVYELCADPLLPVEAWIAPYRRLWASSFDRLQAALDQEPSPGDNG